MTKLLSRLQNRLIRFSEACGVDCRIGTRRQPSDAHLVHRRGSPVRILAIGALCFGMAMVMAPRSGLTADELNVLGWCDIDDPKTFAGFEEQFDVRVNVKVHEDPGVAHALLQQSAPGDWDVLNTDAGYVPAHVASGLLAELDPADYPWDDMFADARREDFHYVDGKLYGVPVKLGWNTIAFDSSKVDPNDMKSLSIVWSDKYAGEIALWDFYVLIIQIVATGIGIEPVDITEDDFPAIREKLRVLKANSSFIGDIVGVQTAMATGEATIVLGGGDWMAAAFQEDNPAISYEVPIEGGSFYVTSLSVVESSERKDLATEFLKYMTGPEGNLALAKSSCFWGIPVNQKAALTDEEKDFLKWSKQEEYIARSFITKYYDAEMDRAMQDLWTEFLQW